MTTLNITQLRLNNQRLAATTFETPVEVVRWLGAVQSQDYAGGKWALGLRLRGASDDAVERAFTDGAILRTHVMRPTWHFVTPADIRWMLALTAPRVQMAMGYYSRQLELDDAVFARSNDTLVKALEGGRQLTRTELGAALQQAGIAGDDLFQIGHLLMRAELDAVICSGARRGKQFTYALLDERVPETKTLARDEALAELARRYFTSHGPATLKDYAWWSGLTVTDTRAGLDMVKADFVHEVVDDQTYWFAASTPTSTPKDHAAYLLPNYDEYLVAYTDRSAFFAEQHTSKLDARGNILFSHAIVLDGQIVGIWKRTLKKGVVILELNLFMSLSDAEHQALSAAAERYGQFLGLKVSVAE